MSRESEYKARCYEAKARGCKLLCALEDAGCLEEAEGVKDRLREELAALDRQYREGQPMVGLKGHLPHS